MRALLLMILCLSFPAAHIYAADKGPIARYQGAVLQRDMPITFSGKWQAGSVTFNGQSRKATATGGTVEFPAMPAGGTRRDDP